MRTLLLTILLVACSSTARTPAVSIDQLISADATMVSRQPGDQVLVLKYTTELIAGLASGRGRSTPECWTRFAKRVTAGYQVSLPVSSYFVIEGDLPKAEVTACVASAGAGMFGVNAGGDVVEVTSPAGTAYAAWRGRYVVVGNRAQVEAALSDTPASAARWKGLIAQVSNATLWAVRVDPGIGDIVGEQATDVLYAMDWQTSPKPAYVGRFLIHYATPDAAEAGERVLAGWIGRGQFPRRLESEPNTMNLLDHFAAALQQVALQRTGTEIQLAFHSDMFGGPESLLTTLQSLTGP